MRKVVIVYTSNPWNSDHEFYAVFSSKKTAVSRMKKVFKLSEDDLTSIDLYNQTQGRDKNLEFQECIVNKIS